MRKLFNQLYLIRLPSITALWWHHRDVIREQCLSSDIAVLSNTLSSISWPDIQRHVWGFFFSLPSVTKINSWRHSVAETEAKKKHISKTGSADSGLGRYSRVPPQRHGYGYRDSRRDGAWRSPSRPGESCCLWLSRFTTRGINLGLQKSPLTPPPSSDNGLFPRSPLLPSNQEAALHLFLQQSLVIWPACSSGAVDSVLL